MVFPGTSRVLRRVRARLGIRVGRGGHLVVVVEVERCSRTTSSGLGLLDQDVPACGDGTDGDDERHLVIVLHAHVIPGSGRITGCRRKPIDDFCFHLVS